MHIPHVTNLYLQPISFVTLLLYLLPWLGIYNGNFNIFKSINCDRLNESLLASQHYNRILKFAKCQTPFPHVVNINNELHPSAIKKYIPHCTILHYCGPHSGCCRQESEQCVPKKIEEVKLYFWTIELTSRGHKKGIEVITMKNHTECMCAPINRSKDSTEPSNTGGTARTPTIFTASSPTITSQQQSHHHHQQQQQQSSTVSESEPDSLGTTIHYHNNSS